MQKYYEWSLQPPTERHEILANLHVLEDEHAGSNELMETYARASDKLSSFNLIEAFPLQEREDFAKLYGDNLIENLELVGFYRKVKRDMGTSCHSEMLLNYHDQGCFYRCKKYISKKLACLRNEKCYLLWHRYVITNWLQAYFLFATLLDFMKDSIFALTLDPYLGPVYLSLTFFFYIWDIYFSLYNVQT